MKKTKSRLSIFPLLLAIAAVSFSSVVLKAQAPAKPPVALKSNITVEFYMPVAKLCVF
jgi:hypothetical protein